MNENSHTENLQEVYYQGSEWIRMCNHIIWSRGTFLVPQRAAAD